MIRSIPHLFGSALSVAVLIGTVSSTVLAQRDVVRPMPYPFSHLLTIASDVDLQTPWQGNAVHRVINREIGLPMSDSVWVQVADPTGSSFFSGYTTLNRNPSKVDDLPIFALLLRQWHRGEIDTFHSWQGDDIFALRNLITPAARLASASTRIALLP